LSSCESQHWLSALAPDCAQLQSTTCPARRRLREHHAWRPLAVGGRNLCAKRYLTSAGQSFPCRCLRRPALRPMFTMHRALCSRGAAFSDLIPAQLPVSAPPCDLLNRCFPPAAHAAHHVHVHDWFLRHGYRECNRRRTTSSRWLQSSTRLPAVVRTRTAVRSKFPRCKRVGPRDGAPVPLDLSGIAAKPVSIAGVLDYIRSTFSEEQVLDSIAIEAAANPSAYHAWRAYRASALQTQQSSPTSTTAESQGSSQGRATAGSTLVRNRRPGEWNWEGVWEDRVRKAVKASLSEPALFGGAAGEDIVCQPSPHHGHVALTCRQIRFRNSDEESAARMQKELETLISRSAEI
jgi:hypothetical protein